jgi:hypothetical protein
MRGILLPELPQGNKLYRSQHSENGGAMDKGPLEKRHCTFELDSAGRQAYVLGARENQERLLLV